MPRASRQQSEATARRIREVARSLFSERGYAAVGLEGIAEAAGVTRGAVYNHFGSKRGLLEAVLWDVQGSIAAAVQQAADAVDDPWRSLEAGCRAFLVASIDDAARRVMLIDGPAVLGWSAWREQDLQTSGRLLSDALAHLAGLGGDLPVSAASALLSGAMNESAMWIASTDDPTAAFDEAWKLLQGMIRTLQTRSGQG